MHCIPIYATSLTASQPLAFLPRLALRSALCDDAFIHIRISYEPGGMFRLHSRQYNYCELALQPAAAIPCICTFYFVSGTLMRLNRASVCFLVGHLSSCFFLPLCSMSTLFCSPCWASPAEGVFCSFHCFAVACSTRASSRIRGLLGGFWPPHLFCFDS